MKRLLYPFLLAVTLYVGGCATLPDVPKLADGASADSTPRILSARGPLSRQESKAVVARLKAAGKASDLVLRHDAVLETVGGLPLTKGNKVTLLVDGKRAYAAIFRAIGQARDSVNVESYKIDDDETGRRFVDLLLKKRAQGVQVNLIYDGVGSFATPGALFDRLRRAGVQVVQVNPLASGRADHRKLLVVDGRLAITGGINISHVYTSSPFRGDQAPERKPPLPWRDTDIQVEGPVAAQFQRLFLDHWLAQKGPRLPEARYFPKLKEEGNALVRALGSAPGEKNRVSYISYVAALSFAEHSIHLTNAYFIPDHDTLEALADASRRGVDVKIVLPSVTDSKVALYAMRYNYHELLEAGVKLYERRRALLHAKTAVVDGVWSQVGSTNFDYLSFSNNYEVDAVVLGKDFATELEAIFAADLAESEPVLPEKWRRRSILERTRELLAHLFYRVM